MDKKIIELVKEKGLLLEKSVFDFLNSLDDVHLVRSFLDSLEKVSDTKMITMSTLRKNIEFVKEVVDDLEEDRKITVEKIIVSMGISLEIKKEKKIEDKKKMERGQENYKVFYSGDNEKKKIEVSDFVNHFKSRYQQIQRVLMARTGLENLTSINKISKNRQANSIIGIVAEKRVTKNKNLIIRFEDLTGEINALVKFDSEIFRKASELQLDEVVAVKASGNNEMLFVHDIIFPDAMLLEKTRFKENICIAFVSDVHVGSNKHLGNEFERFIMWLNSNEGLASKIKYLFFVGDNVDGVGVFPGQERLLKVKSLKSQYDLLADYLKKIPKEITMFMCPGQHDSVRVAEPQPVIDKDYGAALYEIDNLVLVQNPALIKLIEDEKEFKVLMYHGASIHSFINEIEELRMIKAHRSPAKALTHMLKRRHLAPMHGVSHQIVYIPSSKKDPLVIEEIPDVLCSGEVHRFDVDNYNGILAITGSCWQSQTDFEEKVGNIPDPCKVPILNLKTRELKVLDFSKSNEEQTK